MGVAAFLVWQKGVSRKDVQVALAAFAGQLALNTLWSIVFFGVRSPGAAFVEILFLWVAILSTILLFYRVSKPAAWLLLPYIAWVSFAAVLNYFIWILN
jgi:tryptophan-rich sensory protein